MAEEKANIKKSKAKQWKIDLFKRFLSQVERLEHVLHLSMQGISTLRGMPKVIEALAAYEAGIDNPKSNSKTRQISPEEANLIAELAKHEVDSGFPLLHANAAVNLWSLLDALIHSYMCNWIATTPESLSRAPIDRLRIKIGEYEKLKGNDRVAYIVDLLEKELSAGLPYGAKRFEKMLAVCEMSGKVSASIRRDILELAQVRNVILHCNSVIDQQFVDSCPWVKLSSGDELVVTHRMFQRYSEAVHIYATELICRAAEGDGVDMSESRAKLNERKYGKVLVNKSLQPTEITTTGEHKATE